MRPQTKWPLANEFGGFCVAVELCRLVRLLLIRSRMMPSRADDVVRLASVLQPLAMLCAPIRSPPDSAAARHCQTQPLSGAVARSCRPALQQKNPRRAALSTSNSLDPTRSETAMAEITVGSEVEKKFPGYGVYQGTVESIDGDTCLVRWRCAEPEDPTTLSLTEAAKCLVTKHKSPPSRKKATKKPAPKHIEGEKPSKKSKKDPPNAQQLANAPGDASCAAEVRTGLKKVESYAQNWLSKHKKDDAPSGAEVVEMLKLLNGKWPTQARPNVTDTGRPVPGMCAGLVFALGQGARTSLISTNHPQMTKFLVKWCRATLPKTKKGAEFPFASLQVNYNYAVRCRVSYRRVDGVHR